MRTLITGGTGSLGHALVAHLLEHTQDDVVVLSRDELKQARMHERFPDPRVNFFLGDVRDRRRLHDAFHGVGRVVHAAALKRVDAVAGEPQEVVKTNVLGTMNVLGAARQCGVGKVLLVSTDKACEPINAYGASKFMAEQLTVSANMYGYPRGCRSSVVRYGNVLGSRGSVVHVWRAQAAAGDPLTLTDIRMTRFIVTMPEAVQMVMQALEYMEGGETFVPHPPRARMTDLAQAVMAMPYSTTFTGLRPGGEKLHEILLTAEEGRRASGSGGFIAVMPHVVTWRSDGWTQHAPVAPRYSWEAPFMTVRELQHALETVPEGGV